MAGLGVFLLALTVVVLVPGRLLTAILRLAPARLEALVLSLALGMPAACAVYGLSAALGLRWLYWAWPLAGLGAALVTWRRWRSAAVSLLARPRLSSAWPILLVAVALVPLWISPLYFRNLVRESDGRSSFYSLPDVV